MNGPTRRALEHFRALGASIRRWVPRLGTLGGLQLVSRLVGLTTAVVLAKVVGASGTGTYYLLSAGVGIATQLSLVGFDRVIVRFAARGDRPDGRTLVLWAFSYVGPLLVVAISGMIVIGLTTTNVAPTLLLISALSAAPAAFVRLCTGALGGLGLVIRGEILGFWSTPAALLSVPISLLLGANPLLGMFAAAGIANLVVGTRAFLSLPLGERDATEKRDYVRAGREAFVSTLATRLTSQLDVFVLGAFAGPAAVGIYGVALKFASVPTGALALLRPFFNPLVAQAYDKNDRDRLRSLLRRAHSVTLPLSIVFFVALLAGADLFVGVFYGAEFAGSALPLRILGVGYCIGLAVGPTGNFLLMTAEERWLRRVSVTAAASGLGILLLTVPLLGWAATGAAIARMVDLVARNVATYLVVRRQMQG